ncbi:MAG: ABC transporter permease [Eubacteriales bacterium]
MEISKDKIRAFFRKGRDNLSRRTQRTLTALPYVLLAVGIGLGIFSGIRIYQIRDSQKSQIAAELWSGDSGKKYRQITCFAVGQVQTGGSPELYLSPAVSLNTLDIAAIHANLNKIVLAASGQKESTNKSNTTFSKSKDARLWIDAYSAEATCTVVHAATDIKPEVSAEVTLTGVGGDYYLFHPLTLIGGAFLSKDTLDSKKIVLDKELAFKLFGSYDAVGSEVSINQRKYTVIGVVQHGDTKIDKSTSGDLVHAYVLFDELSFLSAAVNPGSISMNGDVSAGGMKTDAAAASDANPADPSTLAVLCYEVVLPDKIDGIAMQNFRSSMETAGKVNKNFLFVDNTNRFSLLRLYDTVFPVGENTVIRQQYKLPFWELSAGMAESVSVFWWVAGMTGLAAGLISGLAIYAGNHKRKGLGL